MHPRKDIEIISYIIDGELTHRDTMGNEATLKCGITSGYTGVQNPLFFKDNSRMLFGDAKDVAQEILSYLLNK